MTPDEISKAVAKALKAASSVKDRYAATKTSNLLKADRETLSSFATSFSDVGDMAAFLKQAFKSEHTSPVDLVPPTDPSNLEISLTDNIPTLLWDVSTDAFGIGRYDVYRETVGSGGGFVVIGSTTTAVYVDSSVIPGETYNYKIKAYDNSANASGFSNTEQVELDDTLLADTFAPTVPNAPYSGTITSTTAVITYDLTTDPSVLGQVQSGVKEYNLKRGSTVVDTQPHPTGFQDDYEGLDVGSPAVTGASSILSGTLTISAGGTQWWGTSDQLRLHTAPVTGDFTLIARQTGVTSAYEWSKSGLIIRNGLSSTAEWFSILGFQTHGVNCEGRANPGGNVTHYPDSSTVPLSFNRWLKLQRIGSRVYGYYSTDGSSWTLRGEANIEFPDTVEVGFGASAQRAATTVTATYDNISLTIPTSLSFTDTGLTAGTTYVYSVNAVDNSSNASNYSNELSIETDEAASGEFYAPNFPRLGVNPIGGLQNYPSDTWATLARYDYATIGGDWTTYGSTYGQTWRHQVYSGIKALNPHIYLLQYVLWDSYTDGSPSAPVRYPEYNTAITTYDWRLKTAHPGGSYVQNFYNSAWGQINPTSATTADGNGRRACQFFGNYVVNKFFGSTTDNKTTAADGFMFDNVVWKPRSNGDYDRSGSSDSQDSPTVQLAWRTGLKGLFDSAREVNPDLIYSGNISDWPNAGGSSFNLADIAPLNQAPQGSIAEYILGTSNSFGEFGGFQFGLNSYRMQMNGCSDPKLVVFVHTGLSVTGTDSQSTGSPAYQKMRYGLGMCLLDDGYYGAHGSDSYTIDGLRWFDEFWGGSLNTRGYLGTYVDLPPTSAWSFGVWRRRFQNGWILVNPRGNGAKTVNLGQTMKKLTGTQAPTINSGALVTSVTLNDEDAIILLYP